MNNDIPPTSPIPVLDLSEVYSGTERSARVAAEEIARAFRLGYLQGAAFGWDTALARVYQTLQKTPYYGPELSGLIEQPGEDVAWKLPGCEEYQSCAEVCNEGRGLCDECGREQTLWCPEYLDASEDEGEGGGAGASYSPAGDRWYSLQRIDPTWGQHSQEPFLFSEAARSPRTHTGSLSLEDKMVGDDDEDFDSIWSEWEGQNEPSPSSSPGSLDGATFGQTP